MDKRRDILERICKDFDVAILYAFGSQAAKVRDWVEEHLQDLRTDPSDVDIGIKGLLGKEWSAKDKVRLSVALEDLFDCNRVDLVLLDKADPFLAAEIIRGEQLFACDGPGADEYELYILRRAGDLAPLERERMSLILGESQ